MQQRTEPVENTRPSQDAAVDAAPDAAEDLGGATPGDAGSAGSEAVPESASSAVDQARSTASAVAEPSDADTSAESNSDAPGEPTESPTVQSTPGPETASPREAGSHTTGPQATQPQATGPQRTGSQAGPLATTDAQAPASPDTDTDTDTTTLGAAADAALPVPVPGAAEPRPTATEDTTTPDTTTPAAPVELSAAADVVELDPAPAQPDPAAVPPGAAVSPYKLGGGRAKRYDDLPDHERIVPVQTGTAPARSSTGGPARWGRRALIVALTLAMMGLIPALLARLYVIPSGSMEMTLHGCKGCDNDRVLVDRLVYRFSEPRPGEIVVFNAGPDVWKNSEVQNPGTANPIVRALEQLGAHVGISPPAGSDFVKRVIAVGGQTVMCCDRRNRIMIDGKPIDESYLYFDPAAGEAVQKSFPEVTVPPGEIFVMGDNRNGSIDSRAPGNGPVPLSALAGKARFIVTPFDRFRRLDDTNPQKPVR